MTETTTPHDKYDTRLNVLYPQLAVIDTPKLIAEVTHPWFNQTLCQVNESVVRLGVVKGEYHWHKHSSSSTWKTGASRSIRDRAS
jgi:hypothetical protein